MGYTVIGQDVVQYDSGPAERVMVVNDDPNRGCDWCDLGQRAAVVVVDGGWPNGACVMHALRWYPELWPNSRRPAQHGSAFVLRATIHRGDAATHLPQEHYTRSDDMFEMSRPMVAGRWVMESRSTNAHYRRTGHFRATYVEAVTGIRMTFHAVVK